MKRKSVNLAKEDKKEGRRKEKMAELKEVDIDLIDEPEAPARLDPQDDEIYELAESIAEIGLINPLTVKPKENGRYEIIAGHRRYLACKLAGLKKVPVIVSDKAEERAAEIMLTENVARKNMSPIEEAAMLKELSDLKGYGIGALARITGKSKSWVRERLDLLFLKPELQKALHEGKINIKQAKILDKVEEDDIRARWLKEAIAGHATANTLEMWYRSYLADKEYIEDAEKYLDELREERKFEPPKGQCYICGERLEYDRLVSIIICKKCKFELTKAIMEVKDAGIRVDEHSFRDSNVDSDNREETEQVRTEN